MLGELIVTSVDGSMNINTDTFKDADLNLILNQVENSNLHNIKVNKLDSGKVRFSFIPLSPDNLTMFMLFTPKID